MREARLNHKPTMTPEEINVEIAKVCGYEFLPLPQNKAQKSWIRNGVQVRIPNYYGDLNAMFEAEEVLSFLDQTLYLNRLGAIVGTEIIFENGVRGKADIFNMIHSTSAQRAESFLKTIGKWKE